MFVETVGAPAALELLAEECAELAHAALKYARVIRGENPTPVDAEEASHNMLEELADVLVMASDVSGNMYAPGAVKTMAERKLERSVERFKKAGRAC